MRPAKPQSVPEHGNSDGSPAVSVLIATYNAGPLLGQVPGQLGLGEGDVHAIRVGDHVHQHEDRQQPPEGERDGPARRIGLDPAQSDSAMPTVVNPESP